MKIVENRKIFFGISISVVVLGLIFMAYYGFGKKQGILNFGIEFEGGTVLTVDLKQETKKEDIVEIVKGISKDKNAQIQEVIGKDQVIIKLSNEIALDNTESGEAVPFPTAEDGKEVEPQLPQEDNDVASVDAEVENIEETATEDKELMSNKEVIEKVLATATPEDARADLVFEGLKMKYNLEEDSIVDLSNIAPTVGKEMAENALYSVTLAALAILIYVSYRFKDTKMGIAAIIALLHDVLVVLALYAIFRFPVENAFIAAILTIVGYSINNTIVVFDRIRENSHGHGRLHKDTLVDRSIKETLTRTVNTSITTLLAIVALYVLGVDSVRSFVLPIIAGIVIGTYSSIVIAAPLWYSLYHIGKKNVKEVAKESK